MPEGFSSYLLEEIMAQDQVQKQTSKRADETEVTDTYVTNQQLDESTADTLDSIDDVLADQDEMDLLADLDGLMGTEEEAEALVREFVQMGGE